MIRLLVIFLALFAGALACVSLLPTPPKIMAPQSAVAVQLKHDVDPVETQPNVRVVYPAPDGSVSQARLVHPANSEEAPAGAASVPPIAAIQTAAVYPQNPSAAGAETTGTPPNAAAQAGTQSLNLNTASVEALNQIPGAGHIGRMIASHRPYRSVEDLLAKRVIRKSVYDRIKDQVAAE